MKYVLLALSSLALVSCATHAPKKRTPASITLAKSFNFGSYRFKAYEPSFLSGPEIFDEPKVRGWYAGSLDSYTVTEKNGCWKIVRKFATTDNATSADHKDSICAGDPVLVNGSKLEITKVHQKFYRDPAAVTDNAEIFMPEGIMIELRDPRTGKTWVTSDSSLNGFESWGPNILEISKTRFFQGYGKVESSMLSRHLSSKNDVVKAKESALAQLKKICLAVTGGKITSGVAYTPVKLDNPGGIGDARFFRTTASGKCE